MPARSGLLRIALLAAAIAALMLAVTSASAPASGSWSTTKCVNALTKWQQQHSGASSKKINGEVRHLEKKHGCHFAG
jgi:hypothetical protein